MAGGKESDIEFRICAPCWRSHLRDEEVDKHRCIDPWCHCPCTDTKDF